MTAKLLISLVLCLASLACAQAPATIADLVAEGAELVPLPGEYQFTEGPAVAANGDVYFTDIPNNRIHRWSPDGSVWVFFEPTGGANGLMFTRGGNLLACEGSRGRVIGIDPAGGIGTPDGKTLYVADHGANKTYRYSIRPDGTLTEKTLFCESGSDGMTLDEQGNLYLTGAGVLVFGPGGEQIGTLEVPQRPTNLCFGGPDGRTLLITARTAVYTLRMRLRGVGAVEIGE
jgi:gluconolactonase